MSDVPRLPREDIERPPVAGTDNVVPAPLSTRGDGHGRGSPRRPPNSTRDNTWAVAFKINVAITLLSAVYYHHRTAWTTLQTTFGSDRSNLPEMVGRWSFAPFILILSVPLAYKISSMLLGVMTSCPDLLLQVAGLAFFLMCAIVVNLVAKFGFTLGAAALAVLCTGVAVVLFFRPGRISFAAANLKVAAVAVKATPETATLAICAMLVRGLWFAVASMASAGSLDAFRTVLGPDGASYSAADCNDSDTFLVHPMCECNGNVISNHSCEFSSPNAFLVFFWAVSAAWGSQVITNMVAATVADSVAVWWSSPGDVESVAVSFRRVMRYSLGSVCKVAGISGGVRSVPFGSAIAQHFGSLASLAGLRAFVSLASGGRVDNSNLLHSALRQLLGIGVGYLVCMAVIYLLRGAVIYLLHSTVYFIGLYRSGFSGAARRAWAQIREHGRALFINEVDLAAGLGVVYLAVLPMSVAAIFVGIVVKSPSTLPALPGVMLLVAVAALSATVEVVGHASKAASTCFLQDPGEFSANHPRWLYARMHKAWGEMGLSHPATTEDEQGLHV